MAATRDGAPLETQPTRTPCALAPLTLMAPSTVIAMLLVSADPKL